MSAEKLRLCTSFDELRTGMLVKCKSCIVCGDGHRGVLVALLEPDGYKGDGEVTEPSWLRLPRAPCLDEDEDAVIDPVRVGVGDVYIVETGNDDEAEREEGRRDAHLHPVANEHFRQRMGLDR